MKQKELLDTINNLNIFPYAVAWLVGQYSPNLQDARAVWEGFNLIEEKIGHGSGSFFFTSTEIPLLRVWKKALEAYQNGKDIDWSEELKKNEYPNKILSTEPPYMLDNVLVDNFLTHKYSLQESGNLILHIRNRKEPDPTKRENWSYLQAIIRFSIPLVLIVAKVNPELMGLVFTKIGERGYVLPMEDKEEAKKISTDKAMNYFLDPQDQWKEKNFLPRSRCVNFTPGGYGYIFAFTNREFQTLENACDLHCKNSRVFLALKSRIIIILDEYCDDSKNTLKSSIVPGEKENARNAGAEAEKLIVSINSIDSWSGLKALIQSSSNNPSLRQYKFNKLWPAINTVIEKGQEGQDKHRKNALPSIDPYEFR